MICEISFTREHRVRINGVLTPYLVFKRIPVGVPRLTRPRYFVQLASKPWGDADGCARTRIEAVRLSHQFRTWVRRSQILTTQARSCPIGSTGPFYPADF